MTNQYQYPAVVVDLNSSAIQAGLSHSDIPSVLVDPVYSANTNSPTNYVFDPIIPTSENDEIYTIFNEGILYNKNVISPLLTHIYKSLNLDSEDYLKELPLSIAQNSWYDKKQISSLSEVIFEQLEVPILSILQRQLCTAYAMSKPNNCIIVDFENDYLSVTPVSNGKIIRKGVVNSPFAGDFINLFIKDFLNKRNIQDNDLLHNDLKNLNFKLSNSYTNYNITKTLKDFKKSILDVSPISINTKIFKTPNNEKSVNIDRLDQLNSFINPIFKPYDSFKSNFPNSPVPLSINQDSEGLGQLIFKSLKNIGGPNQLYSDLLNNLIIQGEMSSTPGLEDIILSDLRVYIKDYQISSYLNQDDMDRGVETWIGANILSNFQDLYLSRSDYLENGSDSLSKFM